MLPWDPATRISSSEPRASASGPVMPPMKRGRRPACRRCLRSVPGGCCCSTSLLDRSLTVAALIRLLRGCGQSPAYDPLRRNPPVFHPYECAAGSSTVPQGCRWKTLFMIFHSPSTFSPLFSPRGETKCVRGPSVQGARRSASGGVLEQSVEHGEQAQRSNGGPIACFDRQVVRNAG